MNININLAALKMVVFVLLLFQTGLYAGAEIVIEKLEDPPYLNPDGTTYTVKEPVETTNYGYSDPTQNIQTSKVLSSTKNFKSALSNAQLSKLERKIFGRNFVGDTDLNRLARLEQSVYGAVQRGDNTMRLAKLATATKSYANNYSARYNNGIYNNAPGINRTYSNFYNYGYNNPYNNPYNMYTPYRPYKRTGLKEFFKVVTGGTLTGFSPSVSNSLYDPYNPYGNLQTNPYGTSNFTDLFSNGTQGSEMYYDDGQYRKDIRSTGGGCGVKVIY